MLIDYQSSGYTSFTRVSADPALDQAYNGFESRQGHYRYLWHLYTNAIFDEVTKWVAYKQRYRVYRQARSIYNPFARLVKAYSSTVYGGIITEDGLQLPDGTQSAIPLDPAADPLLRLGATQIWKWSNLQATKSLYVKFGAALADAFLEVIDDPDREKTWIQVWWPGHLSDLETDPQGNVRKFALEYDVRDPSYKGIRKAAYKYKKVVDQESIRFFKDGKPFDYGQGAEVEHFYGFCPGAWVNHHSVGAIHGANVWEGSQSKLEELNGIVSRVHDQIHKAVASPRIFWTNNRITSLLSQQAKRAAEPDEVSAPDADRESVMLLKGPADGRTEPLLGELDISSTLDYVKELLAEIEADHPELNMWRELRAMSEVTGPGGTRLVGDVVPHFQEAAANYDRGLIAATQMAMAIAGERIKMGDWGEGIPDEGEDGEAGLNGLSRHQQRLAPFDLSSWDRGDLDFIVMPRQILPTTLEEKLANAEKKKALGVDDDTLLEEIGYSRPQIAKIKRNKEKQSQAQIAQQQAMFAAGSSGGAFGGDNPVAE